MKKITLERTVKVPFKWLYHIKLYDKAMDGCYGNYKSWIVELKEDLSMARKAKLIISNEDIEKLLEERKGIIK